MKAWERFVIANGFRAQGYHLAAVLGRPLDDVLRLRNTGACTRLRTGKTFPDLFALWRGRPPRDDEWPAPRKAGARGAYEWQAPEDALLASLIGRIGARDCSVVLTARLRERTDNPRAKRGYQSVIQRLQEIGLQTNDLVGGITTSQAAREIGNITCINQAIARKSGQEKINAVRVGRYWMIPHDEWKRWLATRVFPPKGFVTLASIRDRLGIRSDSKLPEFASLGYIPTAIRCNVYGTKVHTSKYGTWFIDAKVAKQLLADRRAGRPMPWHGKPMPDNLKATFKFWQKRKHPQECETCAQLWGKAGAPTTFEDYCERYPALPHGAKRHLTWKWTPGLPLPAVARKCGVSYAQVQRAVDLGLLASTKRGRTRYVTASDAVRWKYRRCPVGRSTKSWISLASARKQYLFTRSELTRFIDGGDLKMKIGTDGAARGVTYVLRQQCGALREKIGFTEERAASRCGVSVARFRILLRGIDLRGADAIPLRAVQAVIKRIESREGYTVAEAAAAIGVTSEWVNDRITDGTIRVTRARWDQRRPYISQPMLERLRKATRRPQVRERLNPAWLLLGDAAVLAGVCTTTVVRWADEGSVQKRRSITGWRYLRGTVRARAQRYWKTCRFHRAVRPAWLQRVEVAA